MGLKDRILDFVAKWGSPTMDHPAGGGMTGEDPPADDEEQVEESDSVDEESGAETAGDGEKAT
jgi:hypothetical protein